VSFNNAVQDGHGRTVGFRCYECGGVFQSMRGETCNGCREKERRHRELIEALKRTSVAEPADIYRHGVKR